MSRTAWPWSTGRRRAKARPSNSPPSWNRWLLTRTRCSCFSGLKASWNYIHAGASGSFLTGTPRGGKNEIEIIADVSIDQLLGRHFAKETQLASLEMSMDLPANAGACTGNLSCAYLDTLSWRSPTQPLPMEWNPRTVFEQLFGDTGSTDRVARERRLRQQKSILDSVTGEARGAQERTRPRRSGQGRRIYGCRSRRGAPHSDGRGGRAISNCRRWVSRWARRRFSKITWR